MNENKIMIANTNLFTELVKQHDNAMETMLDIIAMTNNKAPNSLKENSNLEYPIIKNREHLNTIVNGFFANVPLEKQQSYIKIATTVFNMLQTAFSNKTLLNISESSHYSHIYPDIINNIHNDIYQLGKLTCNFIVYKNESKHKYGILLGIDFENAQLNLPFIELLNFTLDSASYYCDFLGYFNSNVLSRKFIEDIRPNLNTKDFSYNLSQERYESFSFNRQQIKHFVLDYIKSNPQNNEQLNKTRQLFIDYHKIHGDISLLKMLNNLSIHKKVHITKDSFMNTYHPSEDGYSHIQNLLNNGMHISSVCIHDLDIHSDYHYSSYDYDYIDENENTPAPDYPLSFKITCVVDVNHNVFLNDMCNKIITNTTHPLFNMITALKNSFIELEQISPKLNHALTIKNLVVELLIGITHINNDYSEIHIKDSYLSNLLTSPSHLLMRISSPTQSLFFNFVSNFILEYYLKNFDCQDKSLFDIIHDLNKQFDNSLFEKEVLSIDNNFAFALPNTTSETQLFSFDKVRNIYSYKSYELLKDLMVKDCQLSFPKYIATPANPTFTPSPVIITVNPNTELGQKINLILNTLNALN